MTMWPIPADEALRQAVLPGYRLVGSEPEGKYDAITRLIAELLDVPIALMTIVGDRAQWVKSRYGIDLQATPRDVAFCAHTILGDAPLVVEDARRDARFRDNPLVVGDPHIVFYAGAPIVTADGAHLGALCAIDHVPRAGVDIDLLRRMARLVAMLIDDAHDAARDQKPAPTPVQQARGVVAARAWLIRQVPGATYADPATMILLKLFVAQEESRTCTISDLSVAAGVPFSTAQRWVGRMAGQGSVSLASDLPDHRKVAVRLTAAGRRLATDYLAALHAAFVAGTA